MRTTKVSKADTIYRDCKCGENAHDAEAEKIDGVWHTVYKCRNCRARIIGPVHTMRGR